MNNINEIIETVLKNLKQKNLLPTPTNYEKEFCQISRNTDLMLEECVEFDDIVESLNKDEKKLIKKNNINTFRELSVLLNDRVTSKSLKEILNDLSYFMSPSLSPELNKEINEVFEDLANNPNDLVKNEFIRKLRKLTDSRITKDRKLFDEKTADVRKLILFLGDFFKKNLSENGVTLDEINTIKNDIKDLELSKSSSKDLEVLHSKLYELSHRLETAVQNSRKTILDSQEECDDLYCQIEQLQQDLSKAEEEKSIDFLTKVLTRRAYTLEIEKIEHEYNIFGSKYAIVFFDIDHFKNINDTYGHECGDTVLSTFASILKKLTRTEDVITRYGGEEFVCIVHYKNKLEVANYIKRVKNIISNNKFVHEKIKLNVEFSAGVSFRKNYPSYEEALRMADKLLYKAKETGRNRIILDNDEVI